MRSQLANARIVCDPFHLLRSAGDALDTVRRQRQRAQPALRNSRRAGWRAELFYARHRLLKARERLTAPEHTALCQPFQAEPLVAEALGLREAFRVVCRGPAASRPNAGWSASWPPSTGPPFAPSAPSPKASANGATNRPPPSTSRSARAYAEGVINKVKAIKQQARRLPSLHSFRQRILAACGWTGSRSTPRWTGKTQISSGLETPAGGAETGEAKAHLF